MSLPYYNDPAFTALFLANPDSIRTKVTHAISDFSFTDQHGNAFGSKELRGKIHVANFFLYRLWQYLSGYDAKTENPERQHRQ